ncbi:NIPSNAP family protein [Celeribacter litoreus]|uniref:NIPSNAP family protein n=1 Tax=Celeribacter litoreus TaxID=2876714 RepID=UPI001CCEBE68|nr:NIPSNAP family protein [Celeribacter litoreus]MCA0044894.1 NIPSNAP family protein [Celeribacter litoreus]
MIHELRAYDLKPGTGPAYLSLFMKQGIGAVTRHLPMAGYWLTDTGALNRLYHLWIYESLEERAAARVGLGADQEWTTGFVPEGFPLIVSQRNMLMERLEGGAMLDAAEAGRKTNHPHAPDAPVFADGMQSITFGADADSDQPIVGRWRVVSGETVGEIVTLWGGDPMATAEGAERHEILRPISVSPLR